MQIARLDSILADEQVRPPLANPLGVSGVRLDRGFSRADQDRARLRRPQESGLQRNPQVAIQDNADRFLPLARPGRQHRVVRQDRIDPHEDRSNPPAQPMYVGPALLVRDPSPLRRPIRVGELAVDALGPLEQDPALACRSVFEERSVQQPGLVLAHPHFHLDAGLSQLIESPTARVGGRIACRSHHPGNSRVENRLRAGSGLAHVTTRLERDVQGRPFRPDAEPGAIGDGVHLRVGSTELLVIALADRLSGLHDDAPHSRIRLHRSQSPGRQLQGRPHKLLVQCVHVTTPFLPATP